jgi:ligand-binding sensor protein
MQLTDVMPVDQWIRIENEFIENTGLCAGIMDTENKRLTDNVQWANQLCPKIKGDPRGLAQICSVAQAGMANEARRSGKTIIRECDAGMIKIVVPIFAGGEFLGTAGGCGLLLNGGELDTFYISKVLEIPEEEVDKHQVPAISKDKVEEAAAKLEERVKQAVGG